MSDSTGKSGCGCSNGTRNNTAGSASTISSDTVDKVLQARVAQTYDVNFNVRIVPGRSLLDPSILRPRCRPRGNTQGWTGPGISVSLVNALAKADNAVMNWLARDNANAQRFLADPVTALREAGASLDRAQLKELVRSRAAAETTHLVPPGVTVKEIAAAAFPKGRVGGISVPQPGGQGGNAITMINCGPRRKG